MKRAYRVLLQFPSAICLLPSVFQGFRLHCGYLTGQAVAELIEQRCGLRRSRTEVDFPAVMECMRQLRAQISHHDSIDVFLGSGRFKSKNTITVGDRRLRFKMDSQEFIRIFR